MTTGRLEFTALGRPQPAGSKQAFAVRRGGKPTGQVAVKESNEARVRPWQAVVADAALEALNGAGRLEGPLLLEVDFYLGRPAGHYGTGRNAGVVKASSPAYPIVMPDTTKLLRALEDALTGIVWRDDAQVVTQVARKRYAAQGAPERAEILVMEVALAEDLNSITRQLEERGLAPMAGQTSLEDLFA